MSLLPFALKNILARPLSSLLSTLLMAFGVGIILLVILGSEQMKTSIDRQSSGVDLVVAAKGSPLQIILCSVFHIDFPTGNIPLKEAYTLSRNRLVASAIPLGLGDRYKGYRIVGSNGDFLAHYGAKISMGSDMLADRAIVAGSDAARKLGLKPGDIITSEHGLSESGAAHEEFHYEVAGILHPTGLPIDQLLVTALPNIWAVHDHAVVHDMDDAPSLSVFGIKMDSIAFSTRQITSLLINYRSPVALLQLPRFINDNTSMQAASPAFETARLLSLIDPFLMMAYGIGGFVLFMSAISVLIALINALKDRKYELAILRSLGGTKIQLFMLVWLEGILVVGAGSACGMALAHVGIGVLAWQAETAGLSWLTFHFYEVYVLIVSFALGGIASAVPALAVYRTNISKTLAES
ncbi:MAG: ABC transporter permease [Cyclobacteriaceae bacterium]|nr:ABC transporter permease [Cyclobacteriaceae bacterium]